MGLGVRSFLGGSSDSEKNGGIGGVGDGVLLRDPTNFVVGSFAEESYCATDHFGSALDEDVAGAHLPLWAPHAVSRKKKPSINATVKPLAVCIGGFVSVLVFVAMVFLLCGRFPFKGAGAQGEGSSSVAPTELKLVQVGPFQPADVPVTVLDWIIAKKNKKQSWFSTILGRSQKVEAVFDGPRDGEESKSPERGRESRAVMNVNDVKLWSCPYVLVENKQESSRGLLSSRKKSKVKKHPR